MNKHIIVAAFVVGGSGVLNSWHNQKPITPVIIGTFIFVLVLALVDSFAPPKMQTVVGAIAMLAVMYVLLTEFPWDWIFQALKSSGQNIGSGTPATPPKNQNQQQVNRLTNLNK